MSNPNDQISREDKVSRFSIGPGLISLICFILIIVVAVITYLIVTAH